jgi:hypothetical protein
MARSRKASRVSVLGSTALAGLLLLLTMPASAAELLMFEARGCPWCKRWDAEVGLGYARSSEGQRAPLRRLDIAQRPDNVVLALPVTVSPTFVLVDNGREVGRITGYPGADFFWALLGELVGKLDRAPGRTGRKDSFGVLIQAHPGFGGPVPSGSL